MGGTTLISMCVGGEGEGECVSVTVWVGVVVIAWVRECVGGTALIAAIKYVYVWGHCVGGCGCHCVGEEGSA